ncbi:YqcI/YcgG family protein [Bacillus infantis]|uniref:YqcI/YcgG family protein n=2 Tax=Bacillus infantis TaxID=324767 RepID=A0A5D4RDC8_9BACI|nr:YqcI/YcgG family protein [Bacillus infantis]
MSMQLISDISGLKKTDCWEADALRAFQAKLGNKKDRFPCIPATQGHALQQLRYGFAGDPRDISSAGELAEMMREFTVHSRSFGSYTSLIVFFETNEQLAEQGTVEEFENHFWQQMNLLAERDREKWPAHIPEDPHDPLWEFCSHGEQYFMYCATPAHVNRQSRYFPYFMLAITPRWVLDEFNSAPERAAKVKSKIRDRLAAYDSIGAHPHLNSYGTENNYEWQQYFLRDDDSALSKCPFHRMLAGDKSKDFSITEKGRDN